MAARFIAFAALCACSILSTRAVQASARIYVNASPRWSASSPPNSLLRDDVEKRYTPELEEELRRTRDTALLLYTEYTSAAGSEMKTFLLNVSSLLQDTMRSMENRILNRAPRECREKFDRRMKKIEIDAHRAASFCGENHHKYFLGHMIVFRMHLNRSEDYVNRCQTMKKGCGTTCETTPRMLRWRRLALMEINRVKDDIQHTRKSYKDLLTHARRKFNHLRQQAHQRAKAAVEEVEECVRKTS